ncbi:unnamed protein product [Caenorhabditis brenneri]
MMIIGITDGTSWNTYFFNYPICDATCYGWYSSRFTSLTGLPIKYQVYSVVTGMGLSAMSILAVYENRYALLRDNKKWNEYRKPYIIVNYILILLCFVYPVYQVPEQVQAQQYMPREYPCILEKSGLELNSVFVMSYEAVNVAGPMIIEATI